MTFLPDRVLFHRWRWSYHYWLRKRRLASALHHLSGPERCRLEPAELAVVCVVKDGIRHLRTFVEHHLALGVRHLAILDNGSTDGTLEALHAWPQISVIQCLAPFRSEMQVLRNLLAERFSGGGWCFVADIDERLTWPQMDRLKLPRFLAYLNARDFTTVRTHMLDLFAEGPVPSWPDTGADLTRDCVWYDLSELVARPLSPGKHRLEACQELNAFWGGIRKQVFEVEPFLTKHSLFRWDAGARQSLRSAHHCDFARLADVSCALLHYKFHRSFQIQCEEAVKSGQYWNHSLEYRTYLERLRSPSELCLKGPHARRLDSLDQLIAEGFVQLSDAYRQWAAHA